MSQENFTNPTWLTRLQEAGYPNFESWWNTEGSLVEKGNFRGSDDNSSWSHVSRISLPSGETLYLKRQQNHYPNNILLKLLRNLTFQIEWKNYQALKNAGIPTLNIIHFANRKHNGNRQCIIVSEELKGMTPIGDLIDWYNKNQWPPRSQRLAMLTPIVKMIRKMHDAGITHNALYKRHIYLNIPIHQDSPVMPDHFQTCLIDLERAKFPGANSSKLITHDLEKMFRRIDWPAKDCLWFLKQYLGIDRLTPQAKVITRKIAATRKNKS